MLALVEAVALELIRLVAGDVERAFATAWAYALLQVLATSDVLEVQLMVFFQSVDHF